MKQSFKILQTKGLLVEVVNIENKQRAWVSASYFN